MSQYSDFDFAWLGVEVAAPFAGTISRQIRKDGETLSVGCFQRAVGDSSAYLGSGPLWQVIGATLVYPVFR